MLVITRGYSVCSLYLSMISDPLIGCYTLGSFKSLETRRPAGRQVGERLERPTLCSTFARCSEGNTVDAEVGYPISST